MRGGVFDLHLGLTVRAADSGLGAGLQVLSQRSELNPCLVASLGAHHPPVGAVVLEVVNVLGVLHRGVSAGTLDHQVFELVAPILVERPHSEGLAELQTLAFCVEALGFAEVRSAGAANA